MATMDVLNRTIGRGLGLWRYPMWLGVAALVAAPAVAMRLNVEGVYWTVTDFVFAGVVLGGAAVLAELVGLYTRTLPARLLGLAVIGALVVGVWGGAVSGVL